MFQSTFGNIMYVSTLKGRKYMIFIKEEPEL